MRIYEVLGKAYLGLELARFSALSEQRVSKKTEKLELRLPSAMDFMSSSKGLTKASRFLAVISNSTRPLLAVAYPSPSPGGNGEYFQCQANHLY